MNQEGIRMPELDVRKTDRKLEIVLNRPAEENRLTYSMMMLIRDTVIESQNDADIRALVFRGEGTHFCEGESRQDLGEWPTEFAGRAPGGEHGAPPLPQQAMISAVRSCSKPTIALLTGHTSGIGLDLACASDHRLASKSAVLSDGRVKEASHVATGITHMLPRLIGLSQATRLILLGDKLPAEEALSMGLVHEVYSDKDFEKQTKEFIDTIARLATRSYSIIKEQTIEQLDMPYEWALKHSLAVRQTNVIEDRMEAADAFREKRDPEFSGR